MPYIAEELSRQALGYIQMDLLAAYDAALLSGRKALD